MEFARVVIIGDSALRLAINNPLIACWPSSKVCGKSSWVEMKEAQAIEGKFWTKLLTL